MVNLNDRQREAVSHISGPCLVIAGAGSGKTSVICEKICHLLTNCGYGPTEICAVTFTNKAAREMKDRAARALPSDRAKGLLVTTFHSLGLHIIKRELSALKLKHNFILLDSHDQKRWISRILKEELGQNSEGNSQEISDDDISDVINRISLAKMEGLTPEEAKSSAKDEFALLAAEVYASYASQMESCGVLDFDDLILKPMRLLKNSETARTRWQRRFRYILVDEYQDTNAAQYEFIKLLIGQRERFTFVGDDDQSIYAWRGARPENINLLVKDYPTLKVIKLEQNYRSVGTILNAANEIISHNAHLFEKKLFSAYGMGDKILVKETENPEKEALFVASTIIEKKYVRQAKWRDFAILFRTNFQSRGIEKTLMENRIPYRISGDISFFEKAEIKDLMAYYRLLASTDDDNALIRIVNVPPRRIGGVTTEKLGILASSRGISMFDAISVPDAGDYLPSEGLKGLKAFKDMIDESRKLIDEGHPLAAVDKIYDDAAYRAYLFETSGSEHAAEARDSNTRQLRTWIAGKIKGDPDNDSEPMEFADAVRSLCLREMLEQTGTQDDPDNQPDQVQLMTLHSSKGLEFDHVIIPGCEEGTLPHTNSIESDTIEEERRLMYVGVTRAKQTLTITWTKNRGKEKGSISRFVSEMPDKYIDMRLLGKTAVYTEEEAKDALNALFDAFK